jgi:hypothetical protein
MNPKRPLPDAVIKLIAADHIESEVTESMDANPKRGCVHRNLHPGRVDGSRTVCLDCQSPIVVTLGYYLSGLSIEEQYATLLAALEAQKEEERP